MIIVAVGQAQSRPPQRLHKPDDRAKQIIFSLQVFQQSLAMKFAETCKPLSINPRMKYLSSNIGCGKLGLYLLGLPALIAKF